MWWISGRVDGIAAELQVPPRRRRFFCRSGHRSGSIQVGPSRPFGVWALMPSAPDNGCSIDTRTMGTLASDTPVSVVIVEDQTIFRELLAEVLSAEGGYRILGQYSEGTPAIEACSRLRPDLVILDAVLPDLNGLDVLARLMAQCPGTAVLMVTAHERPALVQDAVRLGAKGFVTKGTPLRELREGIRRVADHGTYFCSVTSGILASNLKSPPSEAELSPR